jgi:HTH-type transcriptional regulator/antitoxin HigA
VETAMNEALSFQQLVPAWQSLQALAPLAHIDSEQDYDQMTALLQQLLDAVRDDTQHPLYSLLTVVGDLIETYERDQEPFSEGARLQ